MIRFRAGKRQLAQGAGWRPFPVLHATPRPHQDGGSGLRFDQDMQYVSRVRLLRECPSWAETCVTGTPLAICTDA